MLAEQMVPASDGTPIHATSEGSGPTIVLCDGLGCDGFIWRYLRPAFRSRYRIVHWNMRGHGKSGVPRDPGAYSIEQSSADLGAVLDALNVERAILIGHSLGVQVSLQYALDAPERVAALAPLCGAYGQPLETFHNVSVLAHLLPYLSEATERLPEIASWVWRQVLSSELLYQYATAFEVSGPLVRREDFQPYFDHLLSMDVEVFFRTLVGAQRHSVEDRLAELTMPALVVGGDKDTFTPVWIARRMARLMPDSELFVLPGGTHIAPIELPELLELRLTRFLEERVLPNLEAGHNGKRAPQAAKTPRRKKKTATAQTAE